MNRRRWLIHVVLRSLRFRTARSLLLLAVLAMAASLITSLGIVSVTTEMRVAEEVRNYGANLVILPESSRMQIGSGGLNFGQISEPAYLDNAEIDRVLASSADSLVGHSFHLRGTLRLAGQDLAVEGVDFSQIARLFPWWQVQGSWPAENQALIGRDLAESLKLKTGDRLSLNGAEENLELQIAGLLETGGEEDKLLFLPLPRYQKALGLGRVLTQVRLQADTGRVTLEETAARLQAGLEGASVREVRQVASTSAALLKKVQLLMMLVTAIVVIASGGSVAGTMSTTVLERRPEIGLLKAMGGHRRDVVTIFAAEALLLGLAGGVAGYLVGNAIAWLITQSVFASAPAFLPQYLFPSLGVSLGLAILGSLGPMIAVFRLDPVQSLRGE